MNFSLSEDHEMLRDSAQSFVDKEVDLAPLLIPGATVAAAGYDALWPKIAEMGWAGITIPEVYGGLGMTYVDLAMIIEQCGRTLAPSPLFGTLAGVWAIEAAGNEMQKSSLLGAVASGSCKLALAFADERGVPGSGVVAVAGQEGYRLSGSRHFVVDAASADRIVVAADLDGTSRWFVVDKAASGLTVALVPWRDITREVALVTLDGVAAELLDGTAEDTWPWIRDRMYLVLAAESAAGTHAVLDDAVAYAKERRAFGKPIGAFQSIKHDLAEIKGQSEAAATAVLYAAWALSDAPEKAPIAAAIAQAYASEAYRHATFRNIQIFGAIGFTWEMKNHLFYKRARANAELLGSPAAQREEIVRLLERQAA